MSDPYRDDVYWPRETIRKVDEAAATEDQATPLRVTLLAVAKLGIYATTPRLG